jgi:hypothetical protein
MINKNIYRLFLWGWCSICGVHIVCPKCGNNTCNGSFGDSDGDPKKAGRGKSGDFSCEFCNLAYQYANLCYANGLEPKNKRQVASFNKKIIKKEG